MSAAHEEIAGLRRDIDAVRASIPSLTIYANQPRFSPPLWNDLARGILPALPTVGALLGDGGPPAAIEALRQESLILTAKQQNDFATWGWDNVLAEAEADTAPLPSPPDREGYFGNMHVAYWLSGLGDRRSLLDCAERHDVRVRRFLDFGGSSGRVTRHFPRTRVDETYGADIQIQAVDWARQHLSGVTTVLNLSTPPLPFEDNFLDMIHAGSVFTHIAEFEEAWLLELRRVLRTGGIAYLTIHPERIWSQMGNPDHIVSRVVLSAPHRVEPSYEPLTLDVLKGPMPTPRVVFRLLTYPVNNTNVVHSDAWIAERWGALFDIVERIPHAHGDHQDAIILRKR